MKHKKIIYYLILLIIIIFYLGNTFYFIINDKIFPDNDTALHYRNTLGVYNYIQDFEFKKAFLSNSHYPPLLNFISIPFLFLYEKSYNSANLANLIFLIILILSVYGIAKKYKNRFAGYLAILILFSFPHIIGMSRQYMLEFALTAMVCLSIYSLIKTENFIEKKESIIFGITLAFGMLTKWTFIFFIIGPITYIIFVSLKNGGRRNKIINLLISAIIGVFISLIWYFPNLNHIFSILHQVSTFNNKSLIINPNALIFIITYIKSLASQQLYPLFFFLFVICFVHALYKRKYLLFVVWFIIPLLSFSLLQSNSINPRYIMPYLPSVAILISLAVFEIKTIKLRNIIFFILAILAISHYSLFSYSPSFGKELSVQDNRRDHLGYLKLPEKIDKTMEKIKFVENCNNGVNISVITNFGKIGYEKIYLSIIEDFPECNVHIFHPIGSCAGGFGCSFSKEYYIDMFKSSDYVLDDNYKPRISDNSDLSLLTYKHHILQKSIFEEQKKNFKLINKIEEEDGYSAYVYKRIEKE